MAETIYKFCLPRQAFPGWYVRTIKDFDLFLLPDGTVNISLNGREYFKDKESALEAIKTYNKKYVPAKVHKLLEPRASKLYANKWIVSTEDKQAFLRMDSTVVYGIGTTDNPIYFPTYTSALFHKLRYERLNKGV